MPYKESSIDKSIREHMEAMAAKPKKIRPIKNMVFSYSVDDSLFEYLNTKILSKQLGIWDEQ